MSPLSLRLGLPPLLGTTLLLIGLILRLDVSAASACGGKAVPTGCGRTVVLGNSVPSTVLATGGTVDIDAMVYFALAEFPGLPDCPLGPYEVDLDFAVTCLPAGDTTATVLGLSIAPGFNPFTLPVVMPPGPPRVCTVSGMATVRASDGSTVEASNEQARMCLVDPAAGTPTLPRLDVALVDPLTGNALAHPGEPTSHLVRVTNRDPLQSFSGEAAVRGENVAKVPGATGIGTPGDGVFSPSDPGAGDNFPMAWGTGGPACIALPPDPLAAGVPLLTQPIQLAPGEFVDLEVLTRSWGMCADGSCQQSQAVVEGSFSDATEGLACTSFSTFTDITAPPSYLWPDTGATVLFDFPPDPLSAVAPFAALPLPGQPAASLFLQGPPPLIEIPPAQPQAGNVVVDRLDPERIRLRSTFTTPQPILPTEPFFLQLPILIGGDGGDVTGVELLDLQPLPGAPFGFADLQPLYMGQFQVTQLIDDVPVLSVLDFTLQIQGFGLDPLGAPVMPLELQPQAILPLPLPPTQAGVEFGLQAVLLPGPPGTQDVLIDADIRVHAARGAGLLHDDFELGTLDAWSVSTP